MPAIRYTGTNRLAVALFLAGTAPIPNVLLRDQRGLRLDGRTVAVPGDTIVRAPGGGKLRVLVALLALAAALVAPAAAQAQQRLPCADRAVILDNLARDYDETPHTFGIAKDGSLVEMIVSPTGTWTLLQTFAGKPACIVAMGEHFEMLPLIRGEPS